MSKMDTKKNVKFDEEVFKEVMKIWRQEQAKALKKQQRAKRHKNAKK